MAHIRTCKPRKPFMIERNGADAGYPGDDFARINYRGNVVTVENMRVRWVAWDGTRYATKSEAQFVIDNTPAMTGAGVIEVVEEVRYSSR